MIHDHRPVASGEHRAERGIVVSGTTRVTHGEESFLVAENESTYIPIGTRHRLQNPGKVPLEIIEVERMKAEGKNAQPSQVRSSANTPTIRPADALALSENFTPDFLVLT